VDRIGRLPEITAESAISDSELAVLVRSLPRGDPRREEACETLVARYQPLVRSCVRSYHGGPDLTEDLTQVGYLGLLKAINSFDPGLGTTLAAYARPCITGEIKRYFRDRRWHLHVSRSVQELRLAIRDATAELTQQLAHAPGPADLARALQVSEDEIIEAQLAEHAFQSLSLDIPLFDDGGTATLSDRIGGEDPRLQQTLDLESVQTHWPELDGQAQAILTMRFYGNMTQAQIADKLGISQMHVSRLLRRALDYLHKCLTETARSA
jgi:RNA polymerase sigma-B factor